MGLIAGSTPITVTPPNEPPEWTGTPTPSFQQSAPGTYDLGESTFDPNGDTLIYTLGSASTALPTGVTLSSAGILTATSAVTSAITSAVIVNINDGTNSSVESTPFNISVFGGAAKRWNPGHYIRTQGPFAAADQTSYIAGVQNTINNNVEDIPELNGAFVNIAWGAMNTTGSTFYWDDIDAILTNLTNKGKQLILNLQYKSFNEAIGLQAPADLFGEIEENDSGSSQIAGVWRTSVMTRYIAALQAIATRYDSDSNFELVATSETAPSWGQGSQPGDYSNSALASELQRMYIAAAAAFTKINFCPGINSLGAGTHEPDLVETCYQQPCGTSDPDLNSSIADDVFQGLEGAVRDYRGTIPHMNSCSQPVLDSISGKDYQGTPAQIIDIAQGLKTTHLCWITSLSAGGGQTGGWEDCKTAIQADPLLHTACPTRYAACEV